MDLSVLPTLCALTVFVCCFRPLVRRAAPDTNLCFLGWTFLLVHYVLLLVPKAPGRAGEVTELICTWSSDLCGLSFILAASNSRLSRYTKLLAFEMATPVLLQALLYSFQVHRLAPHLAVNILFLLPALHLALVAEDRKTPLTVLAVLYAVFAFAESALLAADSHAVVNATLCAVFLVAAYLTLLYAPRIRRGVAIMSGGLAGWALSYPLQSTGWLHGEHHVVHAILDLPRYLTAGGMILSLLDDYVLRAESLALHDPLTGLPNRRLFDLRLDQAIRESQITQTPIACLVIDVDKFKWINDTFGHPVGDGLLQALAKRLSWNLGPRDMLARTGGDEFTAILVEAADEHHIRFIAGAMMAAGCVPVSIQHHLIDVRISIGIAVAPQDAVDTGELHRIADEAMYRAKRRGGGGVAFAHEEMGQIHVL